ncbi:uncharacterized protein LOC105919169 isoform X2 [Fundulus heteroclitus]|uniref:uncharacterized protein LOC105919169 isoform X2 n=1 Tax=Fundulus heteroclitus TaxID=8078 RepID=UPI00165CDA16|nr:uncharacterized protein LOC105919169 isoform X2 [Fundulus heteroclitus]
MEPVPPYLPESILDDEGQLFSSQFSPPVCQGRSFLQAMKDFGESNEPAPQTSRSIFQEQVFRSYEVHQLMVDASTAQTAAEALRGTFDYVQNNRPVMQNLYPDLRSPYQGSVWSPAFRDFPLAVHPTPQNFPTFSPCGTRVWDGASPYQYVPRAPGDPSCGMNTGFLPPSPHFGFNSGTYMLVRVPEFCQGAYLPPHQQYIQPEGCPSWCLCLPTARFCHTGRPPLFHRTRDGVVLNATPSLEDTWPTEAEEEHHYILTPDKTKVQGSHFSSEPLVGYQDHLQTHWTWEDNKDVPNSCCPKRRETVCEEQNVEHEQESPATGSSISTENLEDVSSDSDSAGSILNTNDQNCLRPSDLDILDQFTLEDLEAVISDALDPLCNQKDAITKETPPPPAEIERIIQYLLLDAPISEFEPNSNHSRQDLPVKEEPSMGWSPSSRYRRSPLEETLEDRYSSFPLDDCFEEDMSHENLKQVHGDDGNRRRKIHPVKRSPRGAAREKATVTDARPQIRLVIRNSQAVKGHTDESDGYGYTLRAEQRKPGEMFTPHRSSSSNGKQRKQACARRQLFKTERLDYKEMTPGRAKKPAERTAGQEQKRCQGRRQEPEAPRGKPLDFCRTMGTASNWLSGTQEEPQDEEEEEGVISKAVRRKTQSKTAKESVQPAKRKTKGAKSSPKIKARVNVYEDPVEFQLPQSRQKEEWTGENTRETARPLELFKRLKARVSRSRFPPAQSTESKPDQTVDECSHKVLNAKKCPSRRTKKSPPLKTAERSPDFLHPAFSDVPTQQRSVSPGANAADRKPRVSQKRRYKPRIKPEPSTDQTEDEEAEQLCSQATAKKRRQRSNAPQKRKVAANETVESLWSKPAKQPRESKQRGVKLRIKMEKGILQRTWVTE